MATLVTVGRNLPESFFEEDGEEDDADSGSDLDDNFDEVAPSLEILADHQSRRFTYQGDDDAHQSSVAGPTMTQRRPIENRNREGTLLLASFLISRPILAARRCRQSKKRPVWLECVSLFCFTGPRRRRSALRADMI